MTNGSSDSFRMCYIISSATGICLICVHSLRVIDTSDFGFYSIQYIRIICCVLILETTQQSTTQRITAKQPHIKFDTQTQMSFILVVLGKYLVNNKRQMQTNGYGIFCCQFVHFTSSIYYWVEMCFQVRLAISLKPILKDYLFKPKIKNKHSFVEDSLSIFFIFRAWIFQNRTAGRFTTRALKMTFICSIYLLNFGLNVWIGALCHLRFWRQTFRHGWK